jgi:molybdenum cofactor cytidylyltransferase
MIAAVIPAAGRGSRMGRPKLSLPVGGRPMLERVITALRDGGADPVVVVTGPHDPALPAIARAAGAEVRELTEPTSDMRATVEHGLRWLEEHYHPRPDDAFLLTPGDLPFLEARTVHAICESHLRSQRATFLVPTHDGRRGHPVLIPWPHISLLRQIVPGVGFDQFLRERRDLATELGVPDAAILHDVDVDADLRNACRT